MNRPSVRCATLGMLWNGFAVLNRSSGSCVETVGSPFRGRKHDDAQSLRIAGHLDGKRACRFPFRQARVLRHQRWGALLFVALAVAALPSAPNGPTLVCAVMMLPQASLYAVAELLAFFGSNRAIEKTLGYVNLAAAAFVTFGLVANLGEALTDDRWPEPQFLFWFLFVGGSLVAYLSACGWYRMRRNRTDRHVRLQAILNAAREHNVSP